MAYMTDYQRKNIIKMRVSGDGYQLIAKSVGLTRDAVRNYCKKNNLQGYGYVTALNVSEQIKSGQLCKNCCMPVNKKHTGRPKKFCSDKCRYDWWNKRRCERDE
jgi:hypothetical protein